MVTRIPKFSTASSASELESTRIDIEDGERKFGDKESMAKAS
ncbi:hypothetical protein [Dyadobacter chenwenxiniae]|nr:hypothetical protein [Dyadobacter chenwenxiniae]